MPATWINKDLGLAEQGDQIATYAEITSGGFNVTEFLGSLANRSLLLVDLASIPEEIDEELDAIFIRRMFVLENATPVIYQGAPTRNLVHEVMADGKLVTVEKPGWSILDAVVAPGAKPTIL